MRESDVVRSWRGFGVLRPSWLTPYVLRSKKRTNKQSEKIERFDQFTFITVTQQSQSGKCLFLIPPSPHHKDWFFSGKHVLLLWDSFLFSPLWLLLTVWRLKPVVKGCEIGHLGLKYFDLLRVKSKAKNYLSLLTIKQGINITLIKGDLAWLNHITRKMYLIWSLHGSIMPVWS